MPVEQILGQQKNTLPKILIVDDEPRVLRSLGAAFKFEYDISFAEDAFEAKEILKASQRFDVIISDERMPGLSGHGFLTWTKDHYPQSVRIVLTSSNFEELRDSLIPADVFKCLSKPWDIDELRETIELATTKSREMHRQVVISKWSSNASEQCILAVLEPDRNYINQYASIDNEHSILFETHCFSTCEEVDTFFARNNGVGVLCVDLSIGEGEVVRLIRNINNKFDSVSVILTAKPAQMRDFTQLKYELDIHQYMVKPMSLGRLEPVILEAARQYVATAKKSAV